MMQRRFMRHSSQVLLTDNVLTVQGRHPFRGDRGIAVAMGEPVDLIACRPTVPPTVMGTWS